MSEEHVKELPKANRASKMFNVFVGDVVKVGKFAYKVGKSGKMTSALERLPSFSLVDGQEKVQIWECPQPNCGDFMIDEDYQKKISLDAQCTCGRLIAAYKAKMV